MKLREINLERTPSTWWDETSAHLADEPSMSTVDAIITDATQRLVAANTDAVEALAVLEAVSRAAGRSAGMPVAEHVAKSIELVDQLLGEVVSVFRHVVIVGDDDDE